MAKNEAMKSSSQIVCPAFGVWLQVGEVMSRDVITIGPQQTVVSAAKLLASKNSSCIIVLDDSGISGIITETDFLKIAMSQKKDSSEVKVSRIMSSPVKTAQRDLSILEAGRIMSEKGIKQLAILEDDRLVGIVTESDIVSAFVSYGMWQDVGEIMNKKVCCTQQSSTVAQAAEIMSSNNVSCLVILKGQSVVGVFVERDILKKVIAQGRDATTTKVEQVMSSPVISAAPSCSAFLAGRIMETRDIRRLVIIDGEQLCGIVTQTDIFRLIKSKTQGNITELTKLRRRLKTEQSFSGIVGRDTKMLELFDSIRELAEVNMPVLIQGESGTGKELVAAAIHNEGARSDKPFVPVNFAALPEGVLESELFGHVKGAFTGALFDRKGRFELADGGTIFLDEIGDLPPTMQVKLLRVLQGGTFQRVGGEETVKVDVRIISATNKDLWEEVTAEKFREDLYYRLCVVPLHLPALRHRRNDIPLLVEWLLKKALTEVGRADVVISPEAVEAMVDYDWPGNVRELENSIRYALVKCRDNLLRPEHFPQKVFETSSIDPNRPKRKRKRKLQPAVVERVLEETCGNKVEAARRLGVSRATLYRFLEDKKAVSS
ncbi:MAG: sigma 54-interacting transcriptional regulator [Sedimentisphaerales bacterium]|nr:sigma 54-interacting transcriptional regulator [Sedimentisphaerales bacterium]